MNKHQTLNRLKILTLLWWERDYSSIGSRDRIRELHLNRILDYPRVIRADGSNTNHPLLFTTCWNICHRLILNELTKTVLCWCWLVRYDGRLDELLGFHSFWDSLVLGYNYSLKIRFFLIIWCFLLLQGLITLILKPWLNIWIIQITAFAFSSWINIFGYRALIYLINSFF